MQRLGDLWTLFEVQNAMMGRAVPASFALTLALTIAHYPLSLH